MEVLEDQWDQWDPIDVFTVKIPRSLSVNALRRSKHCPTRSIQVLNFRTLFGRESSDSEVLKESEESDGHQSAGYDSHRMIDQKSSDFRDFIICFAKNRNCFCTLKIFWLKVGQNWSMEFVWNMMQEKHTNLSKEFLSSEVFWKKFEILYAPVLLQSYWSNSWISTLLEHSIGEKLNSKPSKHFRGQRAEFNWPIGRPI